MGMIGPCGFRPPVLLARLSSVNAILSGVSAPRDADVIGLASIMGLIGGTLCIARLAAGVGWRLAR